ncbi:MAG: hypothetical protein QXN59_02430, partial [Candidatus Micrarchaeaceae archaeon]
MKIKDILQLKSAGSGAANAQRALSFAFTDSPSGSTLENPAQFLEFRETKSGNFLLVCPSAPPVKLNGMLSVAKAKIIDRLLVYGSTAQKLGFDQLRTISTELLAENGISEYADSIS